jgi:hypothetical protein
MVAQPSPTGRSPGVVRCSFGEKSAVDLLPMQRPRKAVVIKNIRRRLCHGALPINHPGIGAARNG